MEDFYNSHRQRLIINADDFGISPRANRNTRFLVSMGKIDRISAMARGKFSKGDLDEILRSGVKLDIHFDILHEFHDKRKKRKSALLRTLEFLAKLMTGKLSRKKVEEEWRIQMEKFKETFGRYPDGINSHEHVHFFPPFFKIALKLQEEYSIPYIRFGDSAFLHHKPIAYILHILRFFNLNAYVKADPISSTSFVSLDWIDDLDKFLDNLPEGTIEIACHPEIAEDFVKVKKYF